MAYKNPDSPESIEAARASRRKHYQKNKLQYYKNNKIKKERMFGYVDSVKDIPCMDCGVKYPPYVMDFDHRDPAKKIAAIGRMILNGGWDKLKKEIEKCDIVCANCHRKRTAKMLKYRHVNIPE